MMSPARRGQVRPSMGMREGEKWEHGGGLCNKAATQRKGFSAKSPLTRKGPGPVARAFAVPAVAAPDGAEQSTQAAFGRILLDLAKSGDELADRIVTTAPDVTQTTNLGAFVNQRGLFRRQELADVFHKAKIPSAQKWAQHAAGQHIELGIAEIGRAQV